MTNGKPVNWLIHAGIGAVMGFALGPVAALFWYGKEIGEQSVKIDWRERSLLTDINPFHRNWTRDDRLDLASGVAGVLAGVVLAALI